MVAVLAGCSAPAEAPLSIEDAQAELAETSEAFAGFEAVPDELPCEQPEQQIERRKPNNEALVDGKLPELGEPGHYAGGLAAPALELPPEPEEIGRVSRS
jgi:hypothetical protein